MQMRKINREKGYSLAKRSYLCSLPCHQRAKFNFYCLALLATEQFSTECCKTKTKVITLANQKEHRQSVLSFYFGKRHRVDL